MVRIVALEGRDGSYRPGLRWWWFRLLLSGDGHFFSRGLGVMPGVFMKLVTTSNMAPLFAGGMAIS